MARLNSQFIGVIAITLVISTFASRVQHMNSGKELEQGQSSGKACAEIVPDSESRGCANRAGFVNTCKDRKKVCKCPIYAKLEGKDSACDPNHDDGRKFDPKKLQGKGCKCATPTWTPTARKVPNWKCPIQAYFKNLRPELPDFAATALEWCNSKLVPEDKLVPKSMRGLYWMKNSNEHNIAFCTTRAEWDQETLTATLSPWTDFVWRKYDDEEGHDDKISSLVYTLKFTNDTLREANIFTNNAVANAVLTLPLVEVDQTSNTGAGIIVSQKKGDVYSRPTRLLGKQIAEYYAVRIVDDDGTVQPEWYQMMEYEEKRIVPAIDKWYKKKEEVKTSFIHFEQDC